jgi:hypothetical protein
MYQLLSASLLILLLGGAGNEEKAKAILAKASAAHGIIADNKPNAYRTSVKMNDFSFEMWFQSPDRLRIESKVTKDSQTYETLVVLRGDKGWLKFRGGVAEIEKEKILGFKNGMPTNMFDSLIADSKDLKLSYLGEKIVGGQACEGIRILRKNEEINYYFDQKTGLLVSSEGLGLDPANLDEKINVETRFSAYKKFDNISFPTKIITLARGKEIAQTEIVSIRLLDKLDDKLFQEPKDD